VETYFGEPVFPGKPLLVWDIQETSVPISTVQQFRSRDVGETAFEAELDIVPRL